MFPGGIAHQPRLGGAQRDGLLTQHVDAHRQQFARDGCVKFRRHRDDRRVHVTREVLHLGGDARIRQDVFLLGQGGVLGDAVAEVGDLDVGRLDEGWQMHFAGDRAAADDAEPHWFGWFTHDARIKSPR